MKDFIIFIDRKDEFEELLQANPIKAIIIAIPRFLNLLIFYFWFVKLFKSLTNISMTITGIVNNKKAEKIQFE